MSIPATVLNDWEALSEEDRIQAQRFIRELLDNRKNGTSRGPSFPLGMWEGGLKFMSEDFNELPEGFEEYV